MANHSQTLFLPNHNDFIKSFTQSEYFAIHATFKIHKPFYQFRPSDSVNESSTYPDSQAGLSTTTMYDSVAKLIVVQVSGNSNRS